MKTRDSWKLYPFVMAAFVCVLMLSNIVAVKLFPLGTFVFTAGIIIFPLSYILGDVITEVYGYHGARGIIWTGIVANIFMVVVFAVTSALPALDPNLNVKYQDVLLQVPRLVIASITGLTFGQFVNSFVMSKVKILTKGRLLFLRTSLSTLCGETVDTSLFLAVAFAGILPFNVLLTMVVSAALFKTGYEILVTPITYVVVGWFKKVEGLDTFDYHVSYNPFAFFGR